MRHRWSKPSRPDAHHTYRECVRCGVLRVTRHEGDRHWTEYGDGDRVTTTLPPCIIDEPAKAKEPPRMISIRVVDLEHTGEDEDPAPIEFAWSTVYSGGTDLAGNPTRWEVSLTNAASILLNPGRPILPGSSAVHHLIDEDVAEALPWREGIAGLYKQAADSDTPQPDYYAAFSCDDDRKLLAEWVPETMKWIDVHKVALRVWQDAPRWNLQTLRYWRNPIGMSRGRARPAHRAYPDAHVAAFLLRDLFDFASLEQMLEWSEEPALGVICYYNPWRGKRWTEVDTGFLQWVSGRDFPEDVLFTVRHHLALREQQYERERQDQAAEAPQHDEPPPYSDFNPDDDGAPF